MPSQQQHHCKKCGKKGSSKRIARKGYCSKHQRVCHRAETNPNLGDHGFWYYYKGEGCKRCKEIREAQGKSGYHSDNDTYNSSDYDD